MSSVTTRNASAAAAQNKNNNNDKTDKTASNDLDSTSPPPKRKKTLKPPILTPTSAPSPSVPTNNYYDPLSDVDMNQDEALSGSNKVPSPTSNSTQTQKQSRMKPIVLPAGFPDTVKKAIEIVEKLSPKVKFMVDRRRDSTNLITFSLADKKTVTEAFEREKIESYTFAENSERHTIFALHKLEKMDPADVLEMLKADNYAAEYVKQTGSDENPVYLVFFKKNTVKLNFLNSRRSVGHSIVRWSLASSNKRPSQCKRCQRWGHAANHCNFIARCVKCPGHHFTKDCTRTDRTVGQPSCVNCNQQGHPANSPTCPKFIEFNNWRLERRRPRRQQPRSFAPAPTTSPWSAQSRIERQQQIACEFPALPLSQPSAASTSRAPFVNAEFKNQNFNARSNNTSRGFFSEIQMLQEGFNAIPDLRACIDSAKVLLSQLQSATSFIGRRNALLDYLSGSSP